MPVVLLYRGEYAEAVQRELDALVASLSSQVVQPGTIVLYGSSTPPVGYLVCDGASVSRVAQARLFGVVGTTYGAGDGSTTFTLPTLTSTDGTYLIKT